MPRPRLPGGMRLAAPARSAPTHHAAAGGARGRLAARWPTSQIHRCIGRWAPSLGQDRAPCVGRALVGRHKSRLPGGAASTGGAWCRRGAWGVALLQHLGKRWPVAPARTWREAARCCTRCRQSVSWCRQGARQVLARWAGRGASGPRPAPRAMAVQSVRVAGAVARRARWPALGLVAPCKPVGEAVARQSRSWVWLRPGPGPGVWSAASAGPCRQA